MRRLIILAAIIAASAARIFTPCELANSLVQLGFPRNQIPDWVCLVKFESGFNTAAVGGPNYDGSYDFGLFQLNDKYWCNDSGIPGKACGVTCAQVSSDDISAAAKCAMKVYAGQGFSAWYGWISHCEGQDVAQYVKGCVY